MNELARGSGGIARRIAARLRGDILSGALPVGQRIAGEHELMARFSVSRQSVREALRELGAEGLVRSRRGPGGGAFVAAPDLRRLSDLMADAGAMAAIGEQFSYRDVCVATFEIEAICCRLAAARRDPAAVEKMRRAIAATASVPNTPHAFFDRFTTFHHALWAAAGNEPLAFVMRAFLHSLRSVLPRRFSRQVLDEYSEFLRTNQGKILAAIEAGDGDKAVHYMKKAMAFWLAHPPVSEPE